MSKIFISHSSANNAQALAIRMWLKSNGWDECFLDISVGEGLIAGRWQDALKQAGDRCKVVLCLLSPKWVNSRECLLEYKLGERSGKTIVGVIIESMPMEALPEDFRANWQCFDLVNDVEQKEIIVEDDQGRKSKVGFGVAGLKRLEHGLRKAGLDPAYVLWPPANDPLRAPYPGLRAFEEDDAGVFFGRGRELGLIEKALVSICERNESQMFVIQGASGAGKSSFLCAGLWPRLRRNYDRNFYLLPVIRPQPAAITGATGLITALETALREVGKVQTRASIQKALKKGREGTSSLIEQIRQGAHRKLCDPGVPLPTVVISIDQWEQLYGDSEDTESDDFLCLIQQILQLCGAEESSPQLSLPVLILIAVRSDAHDAFQKDEHFLGIRKEWFELPSLRREDYKAVIEGPAGRSTAAGRELSIDPALTDQLLQDAVGTDALPLLAYTLNQLWDQHGKDGNLTIDEYLEWGGFGTSIRVALNRARKDPGSFPAIPFDRGERDILLQDTFIPWFVSIDQETGECKGREVIDADLPDSIRSMVERMIQARLLVRGRKFLDEYQKEVVVTKLATDAVIRIWQTGGGWNQADRDLLVMVDSVWKAAKEWESHGRGKDWLVHSGTRLRDAQGTQARPTWSAFLGELGAAYILACRERESSNNSLVAKNPWAWIGKARGRGAELFGVLWSGAAAVFPFLLGLSLLVGLAYILIDRTDRESVQAPRVEINTVDPDGARNEGVVRQDGRPDSDKPQVTNYESTVGSASAGNSAHAGDEGNKGKGEKDDAGKARAFITIANGSCKPIDYYVSGEKVVSSLAVGMERTFEINQGEYDAIMCVSGTGNCKEMGRRSWLKERGTIRLGSVTGCWLPRPLINGVWSEINGERREQLVDRFTQEAQEQYKALGFEFKNGVRSMPLSFYKDAELVEAEIVTPNRGSAAVSFVAGLKDKRVAVIGDNDNSIIYALNQAYSIDLSGEEKVKDYIQYFLGSVKGRHGNFWIVQYPEDIPWRADVDSQSKSNVESKLVSIKVEKNAGGWIVRTTMLFKDSLFKAKWSIAGDGVVASVDNSEELLVENIPMKNNYYDHGLRYEN